MHNWPCPPTIYSNKTAYNPDNDLPRMYDVMPTTIYSNGTAYNPDNDLPRMYDVMQ